MTYFRFNEWLLKSFRPFKRSDSMVLIWDPRDGNPVSFLSSTNGGFHGTSQSVAWSYDNRRLALCQFAGSINATEVVIWDITTGQWLATFLCDFSDTMPTGITYFPMSSIAFSQNGRQLSVGCPNNSVHILDMVDGQLKHKLICRHMGTSDAIISTAWSHDGARLASQSTNGTVNIWDVVTSSSSWQCIATLQIPSSQDIDVPLQFDPTSSDYLVTTIGKFDLRTVLSPDRSSNAHLLLPSVPAYAIDDDWITYGREQVIWLPPEYRTGTWANSSSGTSLCLASTGGNVLIFNFASIEFM